MFIFDQKYQIEDVYHLTIQQQKNYQLIVL